MSTALKAHHDRLMEIKPEDASHDASACLFCTDVEAASASTTEGGSVEDKTYTEDEHNAVLAQVADLEAKVAELTKAAEGSVVDSKVAEVKAEMETQLADLQAKLDAAVLEAEAVKTKHEAFVAELEQIEAARVGAEEAETRKTERVAAAKEVASFPDAYLEDNAERFAAMSDEAWETTLEGWRAIATKRSISSGELSAGSAWATQQHDRCRVQKTPLLAVLAEEEVADGALQEI